MPERAIAAGVGFSFADALTADGLSVIAEIKRRSPSRGTLRSDVDVASLARAYTAGGAACLSVLTDGPRFGGSPQDLQDARSAVSVPVLRKDFITVAQDVHDSAEMQADAILLILPDIEAQQFQRLHALALSLGLDVLTEVRTEQEFKTAVEFGAYMIGINQRNNPKASAFTVDYNKAVETSHIFDQLDAGIIKVALSGIGVAGGTPFAAIAQAGYDAALIGEALVTAEDPAARLHALMAGERSPSLA